MHLKTVALANPVAIEWRGENQDRVGIVIEHLLPLQNDQGPLSKFTIESMHNLARAIGQADVDLARDNKKNGSNTVLETYSFVNALSHLPGEHEYWVLLDFDPTSATLTVQSVAKFKESDRYTRYRDRDKPTLVPPPSSNVRRRLVIFSLIILGLAALGGLGWVANRLINGFIVS